MRPLACLLGMILFWTSPLAAQGGDDPAGMGPLADTLLRGREGDWRGALEQGSYRIENRGRETGLRYFFTDLDASAAGRRTVGVAVSVESQTPSSQAGLLYGYRAEPRRYFLYALTGDGAAVLLYRDGAKVQRLWTLRDAETAARKGELTLVERGQTVELMLGGRQVGQVQHPAMGAGGVGIFAAGRGVVRFSGFDLGLAEDASVLADDLPPVTPEAQPILPPGFGLGAFGTGAP